MIGAPLDDTGASDEGSAYLYDLGSATPTVPGAALNFPGPLPGDQFGSAVALSGSKLLVGAPYDDAGAPDSGSAYVYDLASATPGIPVLVIPNPGPAKGDLFGYAVAMAGNRVVVGATSEDTGAADAGSVYVYDLGSANPTVPVTTLSNLTFPASAGLRYVIEWSGDLTNWQEATTVEVPADNAALRVALPGQALEIRRYFRVRNCPAKPK